MEIKHFGNPQGASVMLLHGNFMCWRQFEDVIPLLEKEYSVYAVSFDGFDGTGLRPIRPRRRRQTNWKTFFAQSSAGIWICSLPNPSAAGRQCC